MDENPLLSDEERQTDALLRGIFDARRAEAREMTALLQGALVVGAMQFCSVEFGALRQPVRVEQPIDEHGVYESYFRVHLASGIVLRVDIQAEAPSAPQGTAADSEGHGKPM